MTVCMYKLHMLLDKAHMHMAADSQNSLQQYPLSRIYDPDDKNGNTAVFHYTMSCSGHAMTPLLAAVPTARWLTQNRHFQLMVLVSYICTSNLSFRVSRAQVCVTLCLTCSYNVNSGPSA